MDKTELKRSLECLLFVACEPLHINKMAELTASVKADVKIALIELAAEYSDRGFLLRNLAGGWQFTTNARYADIVEKLYRPKLQQLSAAAMETLAIIAYKQPITRAEVSAIRQIESDGLIAKLLEKRLIKEVGRRAGAGRAVLYGTTDEFLSFFGLESLDNLPELIVDSNESEGLAYTGTDDEFGEAFLVPEEIILE